MNLPSNRLLVLCGAVTFATLVVGTIAARRVFDRPGETAVSIVPKEAEAVAVLDLTPGIHQLGAFRKLASCAEGVDLANNLDKLFDQLLGSRAWAKSLIPFLRRSAVVVKMPSRQASYNPYFGPENGILIFPISDPQAVSNILGGHLASDGAGFTDPDKKLRIALINDNLVVANDPEDLDRVRACASGKSQGFATLDDYMTARKAIDPDANLMLFISASAFRSLGDRGTAQWRELSDAPGWFAGGIALRDKGIALSCNLPMDARKWEPYKHLASMEPIRKDLLSHLPSGAYSVAAVSQPEALWSFIEDAVAGDSYTQRSFREVSNTLERESGIDIEGSVTSALKGTVVCALYPTTAKPVDGVDCLILIDDANGAKPADLVERVRRYAERFLNQRANGDRVFTSLDLGKADAYSLSRSVRLSTEDDFLRYSDETSRRLFHGKTIAYATVGNAVLAASSEDLLARGIKAYQGEGDLLASDDQFSSSDSLGDGGPQTYCVANLARMSEAFDADFSWNWLSKEYRESGKAAVDVLKHLDTPASCSLRTGQDSLAIKVFVPLDYDRTSDFLKSQRPQFDEFLARQADRKRVEALYMEAWPIASGSMRYASEHGGDLEPDGDDTTIAAEFMVLANTQNTEKPLAKWTFNPALKGVKAWWLDALPKSDIPLCYYTPDWAKGRTMVVSVAGAAQFVSSNVWKQRFQPYTLPGQFHLPQAPSQQIPPGVSTSAAPLPANLAGTTGMGLSSSPGQDLTRLPIFDLEVMRNEPYARHGYRFKRADLARYFGSKTWYRPTTSDEASVWVKLGEGDRQMINRVKAEQVRRGMHN